MCVCVCVCVCVQTSWRVCHADAEEYRQPQCPGFTGSRFYFGLLSVFSQAPLAILLSQSVIWLFSLFLASLLIKCFINSSDTEAPRTHLRSPLPAPPPLIAGAPAGQVAELFRLHWLLPRHPSARGVSPVPPTMTDVRVHHRCINTVRHDARGIKAPLVISHLQDLLAKWAHKPEGLEPLLWWCWGPSEPLN